MKKKVNIKTFVIVQIIIMVVIAGLYLLIIPKVKPMCKNAWKCANAFDCNCSSINCVCKYQDENGIIEEINCAKGEDK